MLYSTLHSMTKTLRNGIALGALGPMKTDIVEK